MPNTVDEAVLCSEAEVRRKQRERALRSSLRLLYLSNMIPSKGYIDVLEAVRLLTAQKLRLHADFVGHWETDAAHGAFRRMVDTGNLGKVVTHHGAVSDRERIKKLFLDADVFLLPSYYPTEAQPHAIIEALNAGTPVITTRHAGIPEMVRDGVEALFVPPRSPSAIDDAVRRLSDLSTWDRFSQHARRRFQEGFSPDVVRRRWIALLDAP